MPTGARSGGRGQSRAGKWLEKELPNDGNLPRKRELALSIRAALRLLKAEEAAESTERLPTQAELAKRLGTDPTCLSRFASLHPRVPDRSFINVLHAAASADAAASGQDVGLTLEALQTRRINAEAERQGRCRNCVALGEQNDSLTQQVEQLTQQVERLTQKDSEPCPACADHQRERAAYQQRQKEDSAHISRLQTELAELREKAAVEAGRQARWPRRQTSKTPLPVPRRPGDRQRTEKERAAALQLATHAASLHRLGNGDSATLLRHGTTEVLSPPETALVLVELRHQKQDDLADDLIHVYGRDQEYRDIMAVAAELHAEGAVHDAGAILRAALR